MLGSQLGKGLGILEPVQRWGKAGRIGIDQPGEEKIWGELSVALRV